MYTRVIDLHSGRPKYQTPEIIVPLLLEEIIPRHTLPPQLLNDNVSENVDDMVQEIFRELNISHVTMQQYHITLLILLEMVNDIIVFFIYLR